MKRPQDYEDTDTQAASVEPPTAPAHVLRAGRIMIWCVYVLPLSVYALTVLFAPIDVLDQLPGMRRWADGVRGSLLAFSSSVDIYKHARSTAFPQVAMLASALAVSIAIFIALALCVRSVWTFKYDAIFARLNNVGAKDTFFAVFLSAPLGLFSMWAFFCLGGDPSFAAGYTTQGRSGYLFISSIAILFGGTGLGIWPPQVFRSLASIFTKEKS